MEGGPNIQERESTNSTENEENNDGCLNCMCHPRGRGHRFIALIFMCFLGFGSYFCYDNPAALQNQMQNDLNITVSQYTMLYSIYSWPNVILCFIGGFLIDSYLELKSIIFLATSTCIFSMFCAIILGAFDKRSERILRRNNGTSGDVVRLMDVKDFKATFWLVTVICVTYYVAIFPFITLAKEFFHQKFNMSNQAANSISSIVYLISGIASPLLGLFIDKIGKNISWIMVAILTTIGSHVLLAFTMVNPYVAMVIMGIAYSTLASSLWPLVSLIIPEYQLGTAYGVCQAIQNLGLAVISIVTGLIVQHWGYTVLEIFFIASLVGALLSAIVLWILDRIRKETLNMTPKNRLRHQQSVLAAEVLEREKLLSASAVGSSNEFLQPNSDFHIRNRYLSRIGAPLPSSYNINVKGLQYRALR
ncbi:hypothetical protein NQ314_013086 [Rhamnusium bicolor]|uniref:Lysosomal dipeptide transporter MFSD1 n=1 Tax=Rhamnusium bicolor TaxID=1586634 RepID=A0AAV8X8C6_9CUCU|nr:hypothetical protein NQ314_013086 [Rhamnusium bicolor]